jgi:hypothetical protein
MTKKKILTILFFTILAISQASFFAHLAIFSNQWFEWVNFVSLAVAIVSLFERRRNNFSWFLAIFGGFLLDIYSSRFFGFWIIVLIILVAIIKFAIKKYVRIPSYW